MSFAGCATQPDGSICTCNFCACDTTGLSMSSVNPNPSQSQAATGGCGGASCVSNTLNAVGKWGTALIATLQGKPVATTRTGVAVGARGSTSLGGSSGGFIFLVIVFLLIFFLMKKG